MTTATRQVIEKAFQKAEAQGAEYDIAFLADYQYTTTHKGGKSKYGVITLEGFESCQCKAFEYDGFCKHLALCLESENYDRRAEEATRPIDTEEIDALRPVVKVTPPPTFFEEIAEYHREANRSDLSRQERAALHCEYDRLYKHAI